MKKSNMFSNSINFLIRKTVKRIVLFFQAYIPPIIYKERGFLPHSLLMS